MEEGKEVASGSREVETNKKFICSVCSRGYLLSTSLRLHMQKKHAGKLKCEFSRCVSYFDSEDKLKSHIKEIHWKSFPCLHCGFFTSTKSSLTRHIARKHLPKSFMCLICEGEGLTKEFSTEALLNQHKQKVHINKMQCNRCLKQFIKCNYKKHILGKTCGRCFEIFDCYTLYKRHRRLCIKCIKCDKTFSCGDSLDRHLKICLGTISSTSGPFACTACDDAFTTRHGLAAHNRMKHQDEKICDNCGKILLTVRDLEAHLAEFHGLMDLEHKCNKCEKKFYFEEALAEHVDAIHGENAAEIWRPF